MFKRIYLLESKDYTKKTVQQSIWGDIKGHCETEELSREKFYDDMAKTFAKAIEDEVEVYAPIRNENGELAGFKRFDIPCISLMGDPRWFSYYLEEINGQQKRPTRFSIRVCLLHLYLLLKEREREKETDA